ncbi:MAG: TIM barrel protein [Bacteroidota bacterium]
MPPNPFRWGCNYTPLHHCSHKTSRAPFKTLAKAGYKKLEFAGPYYFSSQEERDNNVLLKFFGLKGSGYYDLKPNELKTFLDDLGLSAPSAHVSLQSLDENIEEVLNAAQIVGHQYIVCPMMVISTIEEYKTMADKFNVIGEACAKAGIRFGYHNHSLEFGARSGEIPMDVLLKRTDESLVSFELDIFWTTVAGVDAVKYMTDYPGRFHLMHLKDMKSRWKSPTRIGKRLQTRKEARRFSRTRQT